MKFKAQNGKGIVLDVFIEKRMFAIQSFELLLIFGF